MHKPVPKKLGTEQRLISALAEMSQEIANCHMEFGVREFNPVIEML